MEISVDDGGHLKKICHLFVGKDQFSQQFNEKVIDFKKNVKLKGFRPGKIREDFIKKKYGQAIEQEMVGKIIDKAWKKVIDENDFNPISQPQVDVKGMQDDGFRVEMSFEIAPDIQPLPFEKFDFECFEVDVSDADVNRCADMLCCQFGKTTDKESDSELGDIVVADVKKYFVGDEDSARDLTAQSFILDSEHTSPFIVDQLVGKSAGSSVNFTHKYADDWYDKTLAGKDMVFDFKVEKIQSIEKASLADVKEKFFSESSDLDDEAILAKIREFVLADGQQKLLERHKENLLEFLCNNHDFTLPESLDNQARQQGSEDGLDERLKALRLGFIIESYCLKLDIKVEKEAIERRLYAMAQQFGISVQQLLPLVSKNQEFMNNIQHEAKVDALVSFVLGKIDTEKKALPYRELTQ